MVQILVQDFFQCTRETLLFQAETEHRLRRSEKSGKRFLDISFCFLSSPLFTGIPLSDYLLILFSGFLIFSVF